MTRRLCDAALARQRPATLAPVGMMDGVAAMLWLIDAARGNRGRFNRVTFVLGLALLGFVPGCGHGEVAWTMMPAPIITKDARLDLARRVAAEDRDTNVRVLYVTTRAPAPALRRRGD